VGADTGEQRRGGVAAETPVPERAALLESAQPEAQCGHRVPGHPQQRVPGEFRDEVGVLHQRGEQSPPGGAVPAQLVDGAGEAPVGQSRGAAGQRMPVGDVRDDQVDPVVQAEPAEELRGQRHRMHRGADIVVEARQGEFSGGRPAPHVRFTFIDPHRQAGAGEGHGGGEAVRPRAHHDRIDLWCTSPHAHVTGRSPVAPRKVI
jgi:hypothetical protein